MNPVDLVTGKLRPVETASSSVQTNAFSLLAVASVFVAGLLAAQTEAFSRVKGRAKRVAAAALAVPP